MIRYIPEHKAFLLQGNDYSYVMYVGEAGLLQQLYFGAWSWHIKSV